LRWTAELAIAAGRIDVLIERVRSAGSIARRRFALDALARGLLLADPGTVDEGTREAALALNVDPTSVSSASAPGQPHAVSVPLVEKQRGVSFVRQVHVVFDPVGWLADDGFLEAGARRSIAEAIGSAARVAPPPSKASLHRLSAARPGALTHARVDGPSLACAAYASAVSLWSGRPIRDSVVVTGALSGDAVVSVGSIEAKVTAAAAHGAVRMVVPSADLSVAREAARALDDAPHIEGVANVVELLRAVMTPAEARRRRSPEAEVRDAESLFATGWRGYRWPAIHAALSRLGGTLPHERVDLRVGVLSRLAAAQRHLGDPLGSLRLLEEVHGIVASELGQLGVPDAQLVRLLQQTAMTSIHLCHFDDAERAARESVAVARSARLRGQLIKALGVLGLVALAADEVHTAVDAFEESLEVALGYDPHRTARTRAYLIEAHGAAGHFEPARTHFAAAMAEVEADEGEGRRSNESWVRTSWAGALHALGRPSEVPDALDVPCVLGSLEEEPLPGLLARRWLGLALVDNAHRRAHGFEVLAASPLVHGRALEPHLLFRAHLNVLFEAQARARHDAWNPDIAGRASKALEHVPRYGWMPRFVGGLLSQVGGALNAGEPPPEDALEELLRRCGRLG